MRFRNEHFVTLTRLLGIAAIASSCAVRPPKPPDPPAMPVVYDVVACAVAAVDDHCDQPIAGATVQGHGVDGYVTQTTDANGYTLFSFPPPLPDSDVIVDATGYQTARQHIDTAAGGHNIVRLQPDLPPAPTRDEMLALQITFQGLLVHTQQFGDLPWFEAALPWLSPADRQAVYAAKHASAAWPGGDSHALINLPSGPALYDEPNQPYSADRFGPLDWTAGGTHVDERLADLVVELARAGFPRQLLFLGGDDGERGFPIAMGQLELVADALEHSRYGDLRGYVIPIPGYDGVFYGYTPQHIYDWGAKCRQLFTYCGLEHSTGHIPAGQGPSDWWAPNGPMRVYDLILAEFNDDQFDDTVWQIAGRMLGPAYRRPPEQPRDDDPSPPFYLRDATERGPIRHCAFEFGLYGQVHGQYDALHVNALQRPYFQQIGYTCGG